MTERWLRGNECVCPPTKKRLLFSDASTTGLKLQVKPTGSKSWLFRWYDGKVAREMGLGPYPATSLAVARKKAHEKHLLRLEGLDPLEEKRKKKQRAQNNIPTFETAAEDYISMQDAPDGDYEALDRVGWKSAKTSQNWRSRLKTYAYPIIGTKSVNEITEDDIRSILQQETKKRATGRSNAQKGPLFKVKHETAKCVREYIYSVLNDCRRYRQGLENPAQREFHKYLSRNTPKPNNQPFLRYQKLPKFILELSNREGMAARALEFKTITGLRPGKETIQMRWDEVDFDSAIWTVPAIRMKMKDAHQVPLSTHAINLLKSLPTLQRNNFVFFSTRSKTGHIGADSILQLLTRMGWRYEITPHGMRRTLREWCAANGYPWDVAESVLAHKIGGKTQQAYLGQDAYLEQRRTLLQAFADFAYRLT